MQFLNSLILWVFFFVLFCYYVTNKKQYLNEAATTRRDHGYFQPAVCESTKRCDQSYILNYRLLLSMATGVLVPNRLTSRSQTFNLV